MGAVLSNQSIYDLVCNIPPLINSYLSLDDQLQPNGFDLTLNNIQTILQPIRTYVNITTIDTKSNR